MSRTHRSSGPRLEALREELREKERCMSHGYQSFQHLLEALNSSGHSQCITVWTKDTVAYRCRTCQIDDSSAICEICFHQGDHKFHDFSRYHSESGGCCDCGDRDAWKEDGFCKIHQVSNLKRGHLPAKLYHLTKMTVCWALEKLSISVHNIWVRRLKDRKAAVENEMCVARLYMEWVRKVCSVDVLCNLLSVLVTRKFLDGSQFEKNARGGKAPLEILLKTLGSMPGELTEEARTLFLRMLYNGWFKSQFTEELMKHYPLVVDDAVGKVIKHSQHEGVITECKALDSTLDQVMVQLFNAAPTVMELVKNNNLLLKFTSVFDGVLKMSLNQRGIVSVEHEAIRHKVYLRPQGDLLLLVSHSPVAVNVLNERLDVFEEILKVVTYLQWMNPYTRNGPVDSENDNAWTPAIQLEMSTMAIVFQLIARCYSSAECRETVKQALVEAGNRTLKSLHSYLSEDTQKSMSLHIPLHRVLSAILSKLILLSWCDNKEGFLSSLKINYTEAEALAEIVDICDIFSFVLFCLAHDWQHVGQWWITMSIGYLALASFSALSGIDMYGLIAGQVLSLLELPLRIAVWMAQIRANQWQHESEKFYRLELTYRGSFWRDQSWDMDLLLLQFCAVAKEKMEHAIILRMAECFDLQDLVTSASTGDKMFRFSPSHIQDFLCIILLVVRDRSNTGMNEEESLQYNVIQWLCVRDQTYSQLCRALSAIPVDHEKLSGILAKVANFHPPKVREQGYYCLRPEWWTKFDPLFPLFYSNELEDAQERAGRVGKQQFYWRIGSPRLAAAPYNRLTNLLHTQECHQLLWNVLNHVKFLVKDNKTSRAGEALGVTALQMMEIALRDRQQYQPSSAAPQPSGLHPNDILVNIQLSPYTHPRPVVAGSSTWELRSASMYDLLQELQSLTNAHCLADYAQYTLHILHSSFQTYFGAGLRPSKSNKSLEYQASIVEDDWQRLKKEQQAALLAKFSAQRKAFLEQHDDHEDSDDERRHDDVGPKEGSHAGREAGGNFERMSGNGSPVVTLKETTFGVQECAICRKKCDSRDSPAGWIAFMQCYNMPRQLVKGERAHAVEILEEAESTAKGDDSKQLVTLIQPRNHESQVSHLRGGSLDYYPTEHVLCCGHQMHEACFESYRSYLKQQHYGSNSFEGVVRGRGIIDVGRGEILCPICGRLSNVLLPVVEESGLQRMLQGQAEGCTNENLSQRRFCDQQKKIVKAIDGFASQIVRVRKKFHVKLEPKDVPSCQLLWEVFAGNIVHFEVETREKINYSRSLSSAPVQLRDAWGGEGGHLTALQELGKLAMLSNTSDADIVSEKKKEQLGHLWHKLDLLCENDKQMDAAGCFDLNYAPVLQHLREILKKLFGSPMPDSCHLEGEVDMKNGDMSEDEMCPQPLIGDYLSTDSITSPPLEERREEVLLHTSPTPHFQGGLDMEHLEQPGLCVETLHKGLSKLPHRSSGEYHPSTIPEIYEYMHPNFMEGHLLEVDPFAILTCLLLSCFAGCLTLCQIIWMVEFAYIVAIIQTSIALTRLEARLEAVNIKLVIQNACLPFLRRAALLVQLVSCEELDVKHYGSGSKLMDAAYLERYLEQQDVWGSIALDQVGENKQITVLEYLQQRSSTSESLNSSHEGLNALPFLCKVSKQLCLTPLPSVYQDLLWRSIREKCKQCKSVPTDAAFCLICGDLLCFNSKCCYRDAEECSRHADEEYAGIGIFLLMRTTQVLLMRGNRFCTLPSIYLDQHGEEDHELRRNQKLYKSELRLNEVRRLWLTAGLMRNILHMSYISKQILYFNSDIRRKRFFQETTQETPEGDVENLADIELTDIPDPAGLYDFSELSHSSVNLSSTSVTHQEEDCSPPMELAGQPVPGQPHCIAAADNEVLSSSHQGRQKDFEDQHRDLGNDNDHGNDDTVPPKGLPKGRGADGSSKMSTGNALLLLDPKQNIMTLESTCKTQKCDVGNLAGTGSPDIAELASANFGTFLDSADWLSSMLITNQEEHCDLLLQMVGQFDQPVPDQLHCIAAAHKGQPSSSHQERYIATQPVCIESPFGQGGDILNPTTIVSGQPCLAPYDKGKQQEEQRQLYDSNVWSPVPQQDVPGFVNLPDSAELSEIPGSLNYLEGESVQPILLHEPKCSEIDRMRVYNLKTDCNGSIVGEKTIWQSQLKSCMYRILDFGILEIKKQPRANLDKIYAKMNEDFTYSPYPLNKDVMYKYIRERLRDLRSKWKKKWEEGGYRPWEEGGYRPSECPQAAWKTLIQHWSTEKVMEEAEKMKKARGAVKNPSHVGRGGRK